MRKSDPSQKFGLEEFFLSFLLAFSIAWFSFGFITFVVWACDMERLYSLPGSQVQAKSASAAQPQPSKPK
jgi:hypothetical protein